jgi:signal transduction histidine kinase/ActR/RegA family two-component response regulator
MNEAAYRSPEQQLNAGKKLGLLFVLLGVTLVLLIAGHWLFILEPRLSSNAESRATALAHAQAGALAKVLSTTPTATALVIEMDAVLLIKDPTHNTSFVRGIALTVDYDAVQAAAGSLDVARGDVACRACFTTQVPLYHQSQPTLIGIATFYSSTHFLRNLISSVREKLFLGVAATLLLIAAAWAGTAWLMRRLRRSEANLREVFEAAPFPMMLRKAEQPWLSRANRAAIDYLQLEPRKDGRLYSQAWDVLRRESLPNHRGGLQETPINRPDGVHWTLLSSTPVNFSGTASQLISLADISTLKRIQAELTQAKEVAEAATRAKSTFLATMSHEIRTPLNVVLSMAHLLSQADLPPTQREYVNYIRQAGDALLALVSDILDFTQIESGRLELESSQFSLSQLIQETVTVFSASAKKKGLDIDSRLPRALENDYIGDKNRIRQILINLLSNAVKFTERGGIQIEAQLLEQADQQDRIEIRIIDTGIGVPQSQLSMLFEEFIQSDSSLSRRYDGTGLGLAICRRLIQLMNGEIGIRSEVDQGSCFWFRLWLPRTKEQAAPVTTATSRPPLPSLRLLIVDDEPISRLFLQNILTKSGHQVELAQNGLEALAKLAHHSFDIILLDLRMPGMNGYETARNIRASSDKRHAAIYIIALTADITDQTEARCRAAGINTVAAKPLAPEELERLIRHYAQQAD